MNFKNVEYHFCGRSQDFDTIQRQLQKKNVPLLALNQVHDSKIIVIDDIAKASPFLRNPLPEADGYVTNLKNIALSIHTADCIPVIATDGNWIGALHAGWKGIEKNILENLLATFENLGVYKDKLLFYLGPCIDAKCFEVHNDVAERLSLVKGKPIPDTFLSKIVRPHKDPAKKFVDLRMLALFRLTNERVKDKSVLMSNECTFEKRDAYYSFRRDGKGTGSNESFVFKY